MAQGGRGWFHRKRHQPEPEPSGTTHARAVPSAHVPSSSGEPPHGESEQNLEQWSPEARERPESVTNAAVSGARRDSDVTAENVERSSGSAGSVATASSSSDSRRFVPTAFPAPPPSTAEVVAEPPALRPAGFDPRIDQQIRMPTEPVSAAIDWDAETAAALSDEPDESPARTSSRTLPHANADQLLEDIIREIVGDAAVDTASSLQPTKPAPSTILADAEEGGAAEYTAEPTDIARADAPRDDHSATGPDSTVTTHASAEGIDDTVTPSAGTFDEAENVGPIVDELPDRSELSVAQSTSDRAGAPTVSDPQDGGADVRPAESHSPASDPQDAPTAVTDGLIDVRTDAPDNDAALAERPDINDDIDSQADAPTDITATSSEGPGAPDGEREPSALAADPAIQPVASHERAVVSRETTERRPDLSVSRETDIEYGGTPLADQLADETRRRLALEEAVLPLPPSTRVLTISNQKGGVGKTTTAVNLAAALARSGAHVLVIDLDPQGNASTALGVDHRSEQQSVYDVLVSDLPLADVVRSSTEHERLDCVPATIHLAGAEIELVSLVAREQRLRRALDRHLADMERPYDYVLIDCPPSLGLLTINAFVAAREVLIPIQCEYYALEGLSQLLSNIELIEKHLNPELRLSTILLTMYDSRTNLAQQVAQEVREHFPTQTLDTIIPRSVRVSEAPSYGQSVISYDYTSSGSLSYREAAAEIAWRGTTDQKESH